MTTIQLKHVNKTYENGYEAVRDFNLDIEGKEFVILVGPSGCGKSTTLRMIAGLESISQGDLLIDGQVMNEVEPQDRNIAMVFQNYALYPHMTVKDNISYSLRIHKVPKGEIEARVSEIASMLNLEDLLDRRPNQLSGGQKQRVAMGRALIRKPRVFLMDEPLSNLDAKLRAQMRVEIASLYEKLDTTFIYVTHDQTEAMTLATKIVAMNNGVVQQIDTPYNMFHYPANRFVAGFIGMPGMNFVEVDLVERDGDVYVRGTDGELRVNEERAREIRGRSKQNSRVVLGIRPEHVIPCEKKDSFFSGRIDVYEMLGYEGVLHVKTSDGDIVSSIEESNSYRPGLEVHLRLNEAHIHFFDIESGATICN